MKAKLGFPKRALVLGGLLIGTAGIALAPTAANARNFIGVDVGPLSVGIGANEPDYYVAPPATTYVAPAPSTTYVEPAPTTYVAPSPPVVYQAPAATYEAPRTTSTTTTTTYYRYPDTTTTYYSYQPGYYVPPQTATTYYGQ